ncbi:MAG: 50S ribosomal protein L17 [Gemmatimonadota bacterium]|nr:50S ribosomal protein L17 [Gemmatimonadota bacterium]
MRHRKQGRALSRNASHRRAMLANLATTVLEQEKVKTTNAKAKEVRGLVERLITFAKRQDLHARRQVLKTVRNQAVVAKLFDSIAPRFVDRPGGYTRIIRLGQRQGDAAELSILALVGTEVATDTEPNEEEAKPRTRRRKKAEAAPVVEEPAVVEAVVEEIVDAPETEPSRTAENPVGETEEPAVAPEANETVDAVEPSEAKEAPAKEPVAEETAEYTAGEISETEASDTDASAEESDKDKTEKKQ